MNVIIRSHCALICDDAYNACMNMIIRMQYVYVCNTCMNMIIRTHYVYEYDYTYALVNW